MNEDKIVGKAIELSGKLEAGVGQLTESPNLEAEGRATEERGKAQYAHGEARAAVEEATHPTSAHTIAERTRETIQSSPWISVIATFALGVAFGVIALR